MLHFPIYVLYSLNYIWILKPGINKNKSTPTGEQNAITYCKHEAQFSTNNLKYIFWKASERYEKGLKSNIKYSNAKDKLNFVTIARTNMIVQYKRDQS